MKRWLLALFCFLLPTQLGKHFFLDFSFVNGIRIDYLAPTIHVTDILAIILIILHFKSVVAFFRNRKVLLLCALPLLTLFFTHSPLAGLYKWSKLLEWIGIFAIFASYQKKDSTFFKFILGGFLAGIALEMANAILQLSLKHSVQGIFYWFGERRLSLTTPDVAIATLNGPLFLRPYGTFSHPNSLGGFYLLLYFALMMIPAFRAYSRMRSVAIFCSMLLIFLSFAKTVIGVFVLLNLFIFVEVIVKGKCRFCGISRVVVLVIIAAVFSLSHGDPYTIDKRILLIDNALDMISRHPILGVGIGNYLLEQAKYTNNYSSFFLQPVHNIVLLYFAEMGLVLGGIALALIYKPFLALAKNRAFQFCFGAVFLTGMMDHYWLTLQQNILLTAVVFGLIYAGRNYKIDQLKN